MLLSLLFRVYLAYLAVAFLVLMPVLNFVGPWYIDRSYGRELSHELVLLNPFTLSVEARKVDLLEIDGSPFAGVERARINLSLASLWSEGWVLDQIEIKGLYADVRRYDSGEFNFSDLLGEATVPATPASAETTLPGITLRQFNFDASWLRYTDEGRSEPFSTHIDGITLSASNLSTVIAEGRPYQLAAKAEGGGALKWEGVVSIPDAHSSGSLQLTNIDLAPLNRFIEPWVRFDLSSGSVGLKGDYEVDWDNGLSFAVHQGEFSLANIALAAQDPTALPDTGITVQHAVASGISVTGADQRVSIPNIEFNGLDVRGFSEGTDVSLAQLFATDGLPASDTSEPAAESPWTISIANTRLRSSAVHWRSEYTEPALLDITPLDIDIDEVNWPFTGETTTKVALAINQQAKLELEGDLKLATGEGSMRYTLSGLPLSWVNPNLPSNVAAKMESGNLSAQGDLQLAGFAPTQINMNGAISDFSITVTEEEEEAALTQWKSVRWKALQIDLTEQSIKMKTLFVEGYSGRLHIRKDGTINAQRALMEAAEDSGVAEKVEARPWSFDLPTITISDSAVDFQDESLPIPFRTVIGELSGDIANLSSDPARQAKIEVLGSVDGYAPVKLAGTAQPFLENPSLDLSLSFDGVDLARLSPYSGTYAGYKIERGLLNLDLHYALKDARLQGDNKVIINQLKLGEKVDSDRAVDLPLGLAIALLTDSEGVIDLAVPVSGDVNNPEFGLGSVIASAFVNIITKAVTAPFNLLASLVKSEEDLQRVTMSSGSSTMDEQARVKLSQLSEALAQRPELILVIHPRVHPRADRDKLKLNALNQQLLDNGLASADLEGKTENWTSAIEAHYRELPDELKHSGEEEPSFKKQLQLVASQQIVTPEMLETLASERAAEVKRYLVNELQLPAERAVIDAFRIDDKANLFSGVEMEIDA